MWTFLRCLLLLPLALAAAERARDVGVPFDGTPGPWNAITDVRGVEVGHRTLISGEGAHAVRTGVTVVWPRGKQTGTPVFGGWFSLNGNGEMTGTAWVEESGEVNGPVMITNTHSVGMVRDAFIQWKVKRAGQAGEPSEWSLPIVAETWDGYLNDVNGFHVHDTDVAAALEGARSGPVAEGNVGGGTGMVCYGFKGGIGTASRRAGNYTVGVLVQCNCGRRPLLRIAGVPVGEEIAKSMPPLARAAPGGDRDVGSIIIVVATDAPLLPNQLKRLAHRAALGLARTGSISGNGSGDLFLAFSTANPQANSATGPVSVTMLPNDSMDGLFEATVEATEESIVNAIVGAQTMTGVEGHTVTALPHDALRRILAKYNRRAQ